MTYIRSKTIAIAAVVMALAFIGAPASAGSTTINDGSGVDFDAGCLIGHPLAPVGRGNNVPSPGVNPNCLVGISDGSTESTDLSTVSLSSVGSDIVAAFTVDGSIPAAGSTTPPQLGAADMPSGAFAGIGYKMLFQNPDRQTNTPYVAGCRIPLCFPTPIYGLNEHWRDGFHFFIGFDMVWTGTSWLHALQIGTYDPSPTGGFFFDELGVTRALGVWTDDDPACFPRAGGANWDVIYGTGTVTVKVKGIVKFSNIQAVGGCINAEYARPGDRITNVKALSSANAVVTLPVTIPLSIIPGFSDITTVGGFIFFADVTEGNSSNTGLGATLATLGGDLASTPCTNDGLLGQRPCMSYTPGLARAAFAGALFETDQEHELPRAFASPPDTLGRGPRCWTYTFGGLLPTNPLWVANQPCHIDDDNVPGPNGNIDPGERGTFLAEWWHTNYGFIF